MHTPVFQWILAERAKVDPDDCFMGIPEKWYDDVHWYCSNGHLSIRCLGTDRGDMCGVWKCGQGVNLGPPMTQDEFDEAFGKWSTITIEL